MYSRKSIAGCMAAIFLFGMSLGCTTLEDTAPGEAKYVLGEMQVQESYSLPVAYNASVKALEDLQMAVLSKDSDALTGQVKSRTSDGKDVTIRLKRITDTATEVAIRVGPLGDKLTTQALIEKIRANAGQP